MRKWSNQISLYSFYTITRDSDHKEHFQVVFLQSNETTSSNAMEKEGFQRAVDFIQKEGFAIKTLVTDRHLAIAKYVRDSMKDTTHLV